ncbi:unnamed protein product [Scomber scombrus]|uniref:Unnamed protein product n=1 Tax=Scomber scombrus TaxID=13677 RepID=A0AAV1NPE0_SCOSC
MDSDTGNVQAMAGSLSKNMWTYRENSFKLEDNSEFNLHRLDFGNRMVHRGKRENIALLLDDSVDSVSSQDLKDLATFWECGLGVISIEIQHQLEHLGQRWASVGTWSDQPTKRLMTKSVLIHYEYGNQYEVELWVKKGLHVDMSTFVRECVLVLRFLPVPLLSLPLLSLALSAPPPPFPPNIIESTGGSSRYMYSRLLCGHHDNRHEFDMALTSSCSCFTVKTLTLKRDSMEVLLAGFYSETAAQCQLLPLKLAIESCLMKELLVTASRLKASDTHCSYSKSYINQLDSMASSRSELSSVEGPGKDWDCSITVGFGTLRASEVILGLVFMEPIDMWSLSLAAAELALGYPQLPRDYKYDMMSSFSCLHQTGLGQADL